MKFREAVRAATVEVMRKDARVFVLGIGVPDVKGIATEQLKSLATPETGKAVGGLIDSFFGRKKKN